MDGNSNPEGAEEGSDVEINPEQVEAEFDQIY